MNAKQQVSDDSLFGISGGLPNDSYNQVRTPYSATLHIWGTTRWRLQNARKEELEEEELRATHMATSIF